MITLSINNIRVTVGDGSTVAAAIHASGVTVFRYSLSGQPRGQLCGMGACFECRVTINGVGLQRSCTALAEDGMEVTTDE